MELCTHEPHVFFLLSSIMTCSQIHLANSLCGWLPVWLCHKIEKEILTWVWWSMSLGTMNYLLHHKDYRQFTRGKPETDPYELIRQSDQWMKERLICNNMYSVQEVPPFTKHWNQGYHQRTWIAYWHQCELLKCPNHYADAVSVTSQINKWNLFVSLSNCCNLHLQAFQFSKLTMSRCCSSNIC